MNLILNKFNVFLLATTSTTTNSRQMNFFIEYLIVVDKTVVDQFTPIYGNSNGSINDYIKIMFSHLVNGV